MRPNQNILRSGSLLIAFAALALLVRATSSCVANAQPAGASTGVAGPIDAGALAQAESPNDDAIDDATTEAPVGAEDDVAADDDPRAAAFDTDEAEQNDATAEAPDPAAEGATAAEGRAPQVRIIEGDGRQTVVVVVDERARVEDERAPVEAEQPEAEVETDTEAVDEAEVAVEEEVVAEEEAAGDVEVATDEDAPNYPAETVDALRALAMLMPTREDLHLSTDINQGRAPVDIQATTAVRGMLAEGDFSAQSRSGIYVTTRDRTVLLQGEVPSERERSLIEDMIRDQFEGDYYVTNEIVVRDRNIDE